MRMRAARPLPRGRPRPLGVSRTGRCPRARSLGVVRDAAGPLLRDAARHGPLRRRAAAGGAGEPDVVLAVPGPERTLTGRRGGAVPWRTSGRACARPDTRSGESERGPGRRLRAARREGQARGRAREGAAPGEQGSGAAAAPGGGRASRTRRRASRRLEKQKGSAAADHKRVEQLDEEVATLRHEREEDAPPDREARGRPGRGWSRTGSIIRPLMAEKPQPRARRDLRPDLRRERGRRAGLRRGAGGPRRRADARGQQAARAPSTRCASRCWPPSTSPTDAARGARARRPGATTSVRLRGRDAGPRAVLGDRRLNGLARVLPRSRAEAMIAVDKVPCVDRDGLVSLEPMSLIRGFAHRSAVCMPPRRGSLKRGVEFPPCDQVQVTVHTAKAGGFSCPSRGRR